jgi:chemotaxis response regulator CheB
MEKTKTTGIEITWSTTDLSMDYIRARFGEKHLAHVMDGNDAEGAARYAETLAVGYWVANEREHYAIYRSLATRLREAV